ncbi:hypothetical protein [Nonomuraea phyllanthi]|nr:hypothetical protein [Nonomuraea phyllanthi]
MQARLDISENPVTSKPAKYITWNRLNVITRQSPMADYQPGRWR